MVHANLKNSTPLLPRNPANGSWSDGSRQPKELHATPSPKSRQRELAGSFTPTYRTPRHSFREIPPTEVGRMVHANLTGVGRIVYARLHAILQKFRDSGLGRSRL
jgi:hypothetical protein